MMKYRMFPPIALTSLLFLWAITGCQASAQQFKALVSFYDSAYASGVIERVPKQATIDLADEFLEKVGTARSDESFIHAWLAYEKRHWEIFGSLYYDSNEADQERVSLARELASDQSTICRNVQLFRATAPKIVEPMRHRVTELMGHSPDASVYFVVPLQWTDGVQGRIEGKNIIALNARHPNFQESEGVATIIGHEFIHAVQLRNYPFRGLNVIARSLYAEGGAVFGVRAMFPDLPEFRVIDFYQPQWEKARRASSQAAKELQPLLDGAPTDSQFTRFFGGGEEDPVLPPRMGYYLGFKIYEAIAARRGTKEALNIEPQDFLRQAKQILRDQLTSTGR